MKTAIITLMALAVLLSVSCTSDGPSRYTGFVEVYHYEVRDTVISADAQDLTLSMVGDNRPKDWGVYVFKVWRGETIPDTVDRFTLKWINPETGSYHEEGDTFGVDWITFEKEPTPTSPKLKVTLKKNDTGEYRAAYFTFGIPMDNRLGYLCGDVIIVQEPKPDIEPPHQSPVRQGAQSIQDKAEAERFLEPGTQEKIK